MLCSYYWFESEFEQEWNCSNGRGEWHMGMAEILGWMVGALPINYLGCHWAHLWRLNCVEHNIGKDKALITRMETFLFVKRGKVAPFKEYHFQLNYLLIVSVPNPYFCSQLIGETTKEFFVEWWKWWVQISPCELEYIVHTMCNGRLGVCKLNMFRMVMVIWRGKYSFVEEWFCWNMGRNGVDGRQKE